jgi:phosphoglycolate phosphatase
MTTKYKLLVFDWDGTLMDSEAHIVASMEAAINEMKLERLSQDVIRNIIGLGMREAVHALYPEHRDEDFLQAFIAAYRSHYFVPGAAQPLFPGAIETLDRLHSQGYLMAVATGKSRRGLDHSLTETGLGGFFHSTRCADETQSKPHPQMLEEIIHDLGVLPEQSIMVGDTEYDMEMAQNAGSAAIAVTYGVHHHERLRKYSPLTLVDQIIDLSEVVEGFNHVAA